jgi:hypothetical protein
VIPMNARIRKAYRRKKRTPPGMSRKDEITAAILPRPPDVGRARSPAGADDHWRPANDHWRPADDHWRPADDHWRPANDLPVRLGPHFDP